MKRIIQFMVLAFLAIIQFPVNAIPNFVMPTASSFQDNKVKIKKEELPQSARNTLGGDAFKGWSIVSIYKTKEGEYEVELKKGDTTQAVKFDKDGKVK